MATRPIEKLSLFFAASEIPKLHTFSVTDPFLVIYYHDKVKNVLEKLGTTEIMKDNLNPQWAAKISVDYYFESPQEMVVKVFHLYAGKDLNHENEHELIGSVSFELSRVIRAPSQKLHLALLKEGVDGHGSVDIRAEVEVNTRDELSVAFSGHGLANKDGFFGTSDPFLQISRMNEDGSWNPVWKSAKIENSLNPKWAEVKLSMLSLCNGDQDRPLLVEIFDFDSDGKHQSMGKVRTSVRGILSAAGHPFDVMEESKKEKKGYTNSGTLAMNNPALIHNPTFSEFIAGGCEVSLAVAIDYTGSNGDPNEPNTLHHITHDNSRKNPYQDAISEVGKVIEPYDSNKSFPVLGFGGRLKESDGSYGNVSHCFNVSSSGQEVSGLQGILEAYAQSLRHVMLSGPTLFAPIINTVAQLVAAEPCRQDRQKYTVLLIITDGVINDFEDTKEAIIAASKLPMSIVIIGVGSADFSEMSVLDGDKGLLKHGSHVAERDIVQFVKFNEAAERGSHVLAQRVLAEVPAQLLSYMSKHGIFPIHKK